MKRGGVLIEELGWEGGQERGSFLLLFNALEEASGSGLNGFL